MSLGPKDNVTTRASLDLLYHVSRELSTALDLRTVLERVLFLSMRTVKAIRGSILVMDDNGRIIDSAIISGGQFTKTTTQRLRATLEKGLAGWVAETCQPALVADTSQDERWMSQPSTEEAPAEPKSAVSAPLMARERLVGVITLIHSKVGYFTEEHLALVQAIADQAGIAVLNARLYAESQRQAHVMTALAETAAILTASLNVEAVLARILEQTSQALSAQAISLALIDSSGESLAVRASTGSTKPDPSRMHIRLGQGIAGWVAQEGRGVVVHDVRQDPRFDPLVDQCADVQTRAVACAPLLYRGQVIGVLEVINPTDEIFDPDALLVLTGISHLAGTAVRHAQLFEGLQSAHQSYRQLFEDSIDPILITDWDGRILEANRKAVLASDYTKEALRQMNIDQIHVPDPVVVGENYTNLFSDNTLSYESRLLTRSGHEVPIQVYARQVKVESAFHLQWILRDITERKTLDSMKEDLISMIYHDLRSPLANVISSLDILEDMLPGEDATSRSLLAIASRSTERIQRLTNSLLDINRIEAGQPVGTLRPTDPLLLIAEAVELMAPLAEGKQQKLENLVPLGLPQVMADADMIRRVISNLLENANKYSPSGSHIEIGARQEGDQVAIWVKDDGPGIPATEHERIFDKFTRLGDRESSKGLGLGLAYCRLAVLAHGGRIWVESEPDAGACFTFTLPAIKAEANH